MCMTYCARNAIIGILVGHARWANYAILANFANCAASSSLWLGVIPSHVKSLGDGLRHFDCAHKTLWAAPHFGTLTLSQTCTLGTTLLVEHHSFSCTLEHSLHKWAHFVSGTLPQHALLYRILAVVHI